MTTGVPLGSLAGLLVAAAVLFVARPLLDALPRRAHGRASSVAVLLIAAVVAGGLLGNAAHGHRMTPGTQPAAATASTPATSAPAPPATSEPQLTDDQVAAVADALAQVKARPRDVAAHLALARAYASAQQPQLSTVEYLAVTKLDPTNDEANSALALVALGAGQPQAAKKLVDAVLRGHPRYPEALYTRGLIYVLGLHQGAPGVRDLRAYLAAAPFGAHRAAVETMLAMLSDGRQP
jgi:hypothetical protein